MRNLQIAIVLAVVAMALIVQPTSSYYRLLFAQIAISALLAISFDVCLGFAGMLTMGTATFFGLGAYVFYYALGGWSVDLLLALLVAEAAVLAAALPLGYLAVQLSGPGFFILTLLLVSVVFQLAQTWRFATGGDDGFALDPSVFKLFGMAITAQTRYVLTIVLFACGYLLTALLLRSPLGLLCRGVRENEFRMELLGYSSRGIKLIAFCWSALVAGLAGIGYALSIEHVHSGLFHWTLSGQAMLWAFFGGVGTLLGPSLGAALLVPFEDYVGSYIGYPRLFTGVLLIAVVLLMGRRGLFGLLTKLQSRARPD
jgi:branched-chain amino acid transport system permease protein